MKEMDREITFTNVNGRTAALSPDPTVAYCTVALGIDTTSRLDVGITGPTDQEKNCEIAEAVAYIVEPRLPDVPS